jgi:hypothetical protein
MGPFGRPPGEGPLPLGGLVTDETTSGLVVDKGTSRVVVDKGTGRPAVDKSTGRPAVDDVLSGCTWRIPGKLADAVARCPDEVADHGPSSKPPWPSPPRGRMGPSTLAVALGRSINHHVGSPERISNTVIR